MKNLWLKIPYRKTILLILFLVILIVGLIIQWDNIYSIRNEKVEMILNELNRQRIIDSLQVISLQEDIDTLIMENIKLKDMVSKSNVQIKELRRASVNKQYEVFQYNASSTGQFFLDETGGSDRPPEIILHEKDTCLISPIENITEANIRFIQLDYTLQERDEYIEMTSALNEQIVNYEDILMLKDSVITIQDGELQLSQETIKELQKANEKAVKKDKKAKRNLYIAAGAAAVFGVIAIIK